MHQPGSNGKSALSGKRTNTNGSAGCFRTNLQSAGASVDQTGKYCDDVADDLARRYVALAAAVVRQAHADLRSADPMVRYDAQRFLEVAADVFDG